MIEENFCPLCKTSDHPICRSHVIPNAVFKRVKHNGKLMKVDLASKTARLEQDSWDTHMLCKACEHLLNQVYEDSSLKDLRNARRANNTSMLVKLITQSPERLAGFMLSILWRASVSDHNAYGKVKFPESATDGFAECLLKKRPDLLWSLSYRITALYDGRGYFDYDAISRIVATPCLNRLSDLTHSYVFLFEGFKFEMIASSDGFQFDQAGVIKPRKKVYRLARQNIWEDKTFGNLFSETIGVAKKGSQ
jgi:hypothetical protein